MNSNKQFGSESKRKWTLERQTSRPPKDGKVLKQPEKEKQTDRRRKREWEDTEDIKEQKI